MVFSLVDKTDKGLQHYVDFPEFTDEEFLNIKKQIIDLLNLINELNIKLITLELFQFNIILLQAGINGNDIIYIIEGLDLLNKDINSKNKIFYFKKNFSKEYLEIKSILNTIIKHPKIDEMLKDKWRKMFFIFKEVKENKIPIEQWKPVHILGYICNKYESYYNFKFTFSFNTTPAKSRELYEIKKLSQQLSSDPQILKKYIDWIFENKIIERKRKISSLGYFTNISIINEFKFKFLFNNRYNIMQVSRNDILPANIKDICIKYNCNISTYGELAFIKKMPNQTLLFNELNIIGFDNNILDKII